MDEAHQVIARLERIEHLKRSGSAPSELLDEVRCLLSEGEQWLERERAGGGLDGTERAWKAIQECHGRLQRLPEPKEGIELKVSR